MTSRVHRLRPFLLACALVGLAATPVLSHAELEESDDPQDATRLENLIELVDTGREVNEDGDPPAPGDDVFNLFEPRNIGDGTTWGVEVDVSSLAPGPRPFASSTAALAPAAMRWKSEPPVTNWKPSSIIRLA